MEIYLQSFGNTFDELIWQLRAKHLILICLFTRGGGRKSDVSGSPVSLLPLSKVGLLIILHLNLKTSLKGNIAR